MDITCFDERVPEFVLLGSTKAAVFFERNIIQKNEDAQEHLLKNQRVSISRFIKWM